MVLKQIQGGLQKNQFLIGLTYKEEEFKTTYYEASKNISWKELILCLGGDDFQVQSFGGQNCC